GAGGAPPCRRDPGRERQRGVPAGAGGVAAAGCRGALRRTRCRRARRRGRRLASHRAAPVAGGMGGQLVLRHQSGQRAAAGRAGPGNHLRPDGRDQHGPRRTADDRRLRRLCGAGLVPALVSAMAGCLRDRRPAGGFHGHRTGGHGAGAHGDPLAVRTAAGDAAGHLGHQPDAHAGGAHHVRRAECRSRQPVMDERRHHGAGQPGAFLQPPRHHRVRRAGGGVRVAVAEPYAAGPVRAGHHAESQHGRLRGRAHRPGRHAGLRAGLGHRRAGRRGLVAAGQRRPRPGARVHRRFVHGSRAGRRGAVGRHRGGGIGAGRHYQVSRASFRSRHGQDRHPGADRVVRAEAAARPVRAARQERRMNAATLDPALARRPLFGPRAWAALAVAVALLALLPWLNLAFPPGHALHVSAYAVALLGKFMCYALAALALDLVWGYAGILSLGHGLFFALGGYAHGMYLMRAIGRDGVHQSDVPDFMVFLNWQEYPWYWAFTDHFWYAMLLVVLVPGGLAFVFGYFAFRSRIKGVYFSIITQALTFAAMLLFFRNDTGFGGNNGFTDFKRILGFDITAPTTRAALYWITLAALFGALVLARAVTQSKLGRVLTAVRDAESRVRFIGYEPLGFKLFVWTLSAVMCGVAGALYVPQVGIINPGEMSTENSIEMVIWVATGGRGTLIGPIIGAGAVNGLKTWF